MVHSVLSMTCVCIINILYECSPTYYFNKIFIFVIKQYIIMRGSRIFRQGGGGGGGVLVSLTKKSSDNVFFFVFFFSFFLVLSLFNRSQMVNF